MNRNSSRVWLDRELEDFAGSLPDEAMVLDAGSGSQPYAQKFRRQNYESADFEQVDKDYGRSTYVCDLSSIPVEAARYDAVVFTQVMEHLPQPHLVLAELCRVLKPGGRLFFSAPLYFEEHEQPHDYYRYTQFALRFMFDRAGLRVLELRWLEGFMGTTAHMLGYIAANLPKSPAGYGGGISGFTSFLIFRASRPILRAMVRVARRCDVRHRFTDRGMPVNYMAILIKPD